MKKIVLKVQAWLPIREVEQIAPSFFKILRRRIKRKQNQNRIRFWVREIFKHRENKGDYNQILTNSELRFINRENHFK